MLRRTVLALLSVTLLVASAASGLAADKIKVLIIDGQNNHNWKATTPVLKETLEATGRFDVAVETSPDKGAPFAAWRPDFSAYDVLLSNYNGQLWPEPMREDFLKYVRSGGGFVVVHAANNAFSNWSEYNEAIGLGGWGGRNQKSGPYVRWEDGKVVREEKPGGGGHHGRQHEFNVDTRNPEHPIMQGLPMSWPHAKDELYDSLRGPAQNLTVLATAYSNPQTGGTGEHEPILMTIDFGKGRVFHTVLGHADYSMKSPGFKTTLARGTEWAATGKVTIEPADDLVAAE